MSNMQQAGPNSGGNNNKVDDRYNSGDKSVIGKYGMVQGNPIIGDRSGNKNVVGRNAKVHGNTTNSGNKNTKVLGNPVNGPINDNRTMNNHNNEKCNNSMDTNNYGDGNTSSMSFK